MSPLVRSSLSDPLSLCLLTYGFHSQDIRLLGQAKHGVYDEVDAIDPALLHQYYGAGAPLQSDDEESDLTSNEHEHQSQRDIAEVIVAAQSRNVRHEAAAVARNSSPFEDERDMHAFILALDAVLTPDAHPPTGFNLDGEYESFELYKTGRSAKPLMIPLPYDVWFPRIVVWSKALNLLKVFPLCKAALL